MKAWQVFPIKLVNVSLALIIITGLVLIDGCGKKEGQQVALSGKAVEQGDTVKVHYVGTLDDGTVFDSSEMANPLEFIAGIGQLIPGFDQAITGMRVNEVKNVKIKAADAYGERNEGMTISFALTDVPENFKPEIGMVVPLSDRSGGTRQGTIIEISKDSLKLDLNHPMAGKDLNFKIHVLAINNSDKKNPQ